MRGDTESYSPEVGGTLFLIVFTNYSDVAFRDIEQIKTNVVFATWGADCRILVGKNLNK